MQFSVFSCHTYALIVGFRIMYFWCQLDENVKSVLVAKKQGEKIMLVTFLVIYNIYSWRRWRFFLS
jgi:hypothetical protein